ncbi:unnamed protein product [Rodentolepis nana]|uniref:2-(3-amino-3-carboxypropyl)histidine synthase subunit 2 n=1 Tax=Rodentolepis nana TaxID=102285 RepID=A0A0R3TMK7_RODNA|nr:unnamed protein product [Rodentolepis nana]
MVGVDFDVDGAVEFIIKNGYSRVGLQFPSDLLIYSIDLCDQFRKRTSACIVILGDTPYSNCCVDELAGKRWDIEAVIHFGNACLTKPVGSVDVFYVFGDVRCPLIESNADDIIAHVKQLIKDVGGSILFFYDFRFLKSARLLHNLLKSNDIDVIFTEPALPNLSVIESSTTYRHLGRIFHLKDNLEFPKGLLYLGECDSNFYSILVSMKDAYKIAPILIDPNTGKVNFAIESASKLLRKRYFLMEKAKSAKRIGILMGSLSISKYMNVVDRIKHLLYRAKIAYTTLVVGRLNEAKLMNVPDLDALVLVACPQASLYNNPNLLIPVITPFELECILYERCKYADEGYVNDNDEELIPKKRQWNGLWLPLDFASHILDTESDTYVREDDVVISSQADEEISVGASGGTLVSRDDTNWSLAVTFAEMLADRRDSWNGLDPALGMTEPLTSIQPGRSGIPTEYSNICK